MKKVVSIIVLVAVAAGMFFVGRGRNGRNADGGFGYAETRVDTVWVRDTVRDTVLVPVERYMVRVDTVWLRPIDDTTRGDSLEKNPPSAFRLPVERVVYSTGDYRAVVEGFRPSLVEMELYPRSALVTRHTVRAPPARRWSAGLQAGWGITPRGFAPYLGVGVEYRLTFK